MVVFSLLNRWQKKLVPTRKIVDKTQFVDLRSLTESPDSLTKQKISQMKNPGPVSFIKLLQQKRNLCYQKPYTKLNLTSRQTLRSDSFQQRE